MHSFRQFKNRNSEREHENLKNDPIFSSTFSALFVLSLKIHFHVVPHLVHSGL